MTDLDITAADVRRLRDETHPRDQACLPCWARTAMRDREIDELRVEVERLRAAIKQAAAWLDPRLPGEPSPGYARDHLVRALEADHG